MQRKYHKNSKTMKKTLKFWMLLVMVLSIVSCRDSTTLASTSSCHKGIQKGSGYNVTVTKCPDPYVICKGDYLKINWAKL